MRKKEKGFTLIELLAVIVILAVIALISSPLIMGTIEKAKVNAYKDTVYGILKAGENYVSEKLLEGHYEGETLDLSNETKLSYKGTKPTKGSMTLLPSGSISIAIQNGKYCYMKKTNSNQVEVTVNVKECSIRIANNLIKNGYGEYGNNTNFSKFLFENGVFSRTSNKSSVVTTDEMIPIDPNKKYKITITAKTNQSTSKYYIGIAEYDIDKMSMTPYLVKYIDNTLTRLKQDLKKGDTVVYLNDITNWSLMEFAPGSESNSINKGFIFWNYKDSTGYLYPELTYSRNAYVGLYEFKNVDKVNHTITLNTPWEHETYKAGTKLSQSMSGGVYNYGLSKYGTLTTEFKTFTNTMQGVQTQNGIYHSSFDDTKFRPGTKYIKLMIWDNYGDSANCKTEIKDIILEEIA